MLGHMLVPAAVLVCWSLVMLLWMIMTRFVGFKNAGINLKNAQPGRRGSSLDGILPDATMWKSHNYSHLMEQPTIFYPAAIILALAGATRTDVYLAWAYVSIRIVHSVWQATVNRIPVRAALFFLSSIILLALAIRALLATLAYVPNV